MAVAWVQNQVDAGVATDGIASSFTFTLLNTFTKGNTLVGVVLDESASTLTSVTDNASNTYTILDQASTGGGSSCHTFTSVNMLGVPTTITINLGAVPANGLTEFMWTDELSGARATDGHTGQHAASGTTVSSGNITTTFSADLLWGAHAPDVGAITTTAGAGFTLRLNDTVNGIYSESEANVSPGTQSATFSNSPAAAGITFVVAFAPFVFVPFDQPSFPVRQRQDYRMLAALSKQDEQWPFTAVKTPTQKGFDWDPQFPIRTWHRFRDADERWPFTATLTPAQFGWEWRPEFARRRFIPSRSADEEYPFTAVPTPAQFGWQLDPQFPLRIRPIPRSNADEQWPFTATLTTGAFGWQLDPSFPSRVRWQRVRRDEDLTQPPAVALTTGPFGWDNPERLPLRVRFRPLTLQDEEYPFTAVSTPAQFGWDNPEKFPLRVRFRPVLSADEQYPFTAAVTPTQFGWQIEPFFPQRLRFRPLVPAEQLLAPIAGTQTPTNIDFAYPPEFYTERRKYQPLVYEFWQPDIPPVSPTFQIMTGLATKVKARTGATYVTVTLQGTGIFMFAQQPTPTIFNEVLPFGSAHIVLTSGSMPVSVALGVSNDGVNFTQLGPAVSQFPNIINLTTSTSIVIPGAMPYKYHAWIVTGGDISTLLTITELFVGWRA